MTKSDKNREYILQVFDHLDEDFDNSKKGANLHKKATRTNSKSDWKKYQDEKYGYIIRKATTKIFKIRKWTHIDDIDKQELIKEIQNKIQGYREARASL